jgi:hypothetical protein
MGAAVAKPTVPPAGAIITHIFNGQTINSFFEPGMGGQSTTAGLSGTVWYIAPAAGYKVTVTGTGASDGKTGMFKAIGPGVLQTGVLGLNNATVTVTGGAIPAGPSEQFIIRPNMLANQSQPNAASRRIVGEQFIIRPNMLANQSQPNAAVRRARPEYYMPNVPIGYGTRVHGSQAAAPAGTPKIRPEQFSMAGAYEDVLSQMHQIAPGNMTSQATTSRGGMM